MGMRKSTELTIKPTQELTPQSFKELRLAQLEQVPPETEWFTNLTNPNTKRAYKAHVRDFMSHHGINNSEDLRRIQRAHVIHWRNDLVKRPLSPASIRLKLSALSSLFDYLCEKNAVLDNPVHGVKRPKEGANEGKTPIIGDLEATKLLEAPRNDTLKGKRDRALLTIFLFHGLRLDEVCRLTVGDYHSRHDVLHFRIHGKGGKIRYVPVHLRAQRQLKEYLELAGHQDKPKSPLFQPVKNNGLKPHGEALHPDSIRKALTLYAEKVGIDTNNFSPHSLRATAATNAIEHGAELDEVKSFLGHANIATTQLYNRRDQNPEDSPVFKVQY